MLDIQKISGFSKLSKEEKLEVLTMKTSDYSLENTLKQFWIQDKATQSKLDEISENVLSNYYLPYSIATNFVINNRHYLVPMVTEESSVVAAASSGAKFWAQNGGFRTKVIASTKIGQIHFTWPGKYKELKEHKQFIEQTLLASASNLLANMVKRGGGVEGMEILDYSEHVPNLFQILVRFNTADAMGANIINTCLEDMAVALAEYFSLHFTDEKRQCDIIMAILSNYTPGCVAECTVECPVEKFDELKTGMTAKEFAEKFEKAVAIANFDIYRATTHNKGIMNGVDAVLVATGNDFRAAEASVHAFASANGSYKSLNDVSIKNNHFVYTLKLPLAVGTIGGLTSIHPLAKASLDLLGNPSAPELMQIAASAGMANNFSAIRALITSGIQRGHMKFHLNNILNHLNTTPKEKNAIQSFFEKKTISFNHVQQYLNSLRNG